MEHYKKVKGPYSVTWVEDGIIIQEMNKEVKDITLEIAKRLYSDRLEATRHANIAMPVMVYVHNAMNVKKEAKEFYATGESYQYLTAIAMIMDNYIARLVGNLVFMMKKQAVPTKFFNDPDDAKLWLEAHKVERLN